MTQMLTTYITTVTPQMAQAWLDDLKVYEEVNGPRLGKPTERRHVNSLADAMLDGEWRLIHQGMLLSKEGLLLDGRHRALAVVQSGVSIPTMMTVDDTVKQAKDLFGVDTGNAPRDHSFTTGYPKNATQIARFLLHFVSHDTRPRSTSVGHVCDRIFPIFSFLQHDTTHRRFRAAGYRAAFVLRVLDAEYRHDYREMENLREIYSALCANDPRQLPSLVYSFYRQLTDGMIRANHDGFPRLWRSLDPKDRGSSQKLIIRDLSNITAVIRRETVRLIPETKPRERV
jgi:hypothetical protein